MLMKSVGRCEFLMVKAATTLKKGSAKKTKKPVAAKKKTAVKKSTTAGKKGAASKKEGVIVKRYKCRICGYIYSPLRGEPHNGIPAGTAFEDLPDTYLCPVCGFQGKGKIGTWGFDEWRPTRYICSMCDYVY
ncbi:MAG TPA: rubredoxin, partial [Methanoregula sp.]|nr:rubredoxin [Methanoregula sp.]